MGRKLIRVSLQDQPVLHLELVHSGKHFEDVFPELVRLVVYFTADECQEKDEQNEEDEKDIHKEPDLVLSERLRRKVEIDKVAQSDEYREEEHTEDDRAHYQNVFVFPFSLVDLDLGKGLVELLLVGGFADLALVCLLRFDPILEAALVRVDQGAHALAWNAQRRVVVPRLAAESALVFYCLRQLWLLYCEAAGFCYWSVRSTCSVSLTKIFP